MYVNLRNSIWVTALVGGAAGTLVLSRSLMEPELATRPESTNSLGYYLEDAQLLGMDANGEMLYEIQAKRIEELPDSEALSLLGVRIVYRDEANVAWNITAASALSTPSGTRLDLSGDVTLESHPEALGTATAILADNLRLEPESYLAATDGPVRFRVGETWINAVGLRANLKDESILLESNVHAKISR